MTRFDRMVQTLSGVLRQHPAAPTGRVIRAPPATSEDLGLIALIHEPIWRALAHEVSYLPDEDFQTRAVNQRTT